MVHQIDCFDINLKFFKYFGIWAKKDNQFPFYNYYSKIFLSIFVIIYDFLFIINFYFIEKQMDKIVEEMIMYLTLNSVASKVFTFVILHDEIGQILSVLESDILQPSNEIERNIVVKTKNMNRFYWKGFAISSLTSHLSHIFTPLILSYTLGSEFFLPVCSYEFIPEKWRKQYVYPLYLYQGIGVQINMWFNVNVDSFFYGLMNLTLAQLDILDIKLRNVTERETNHKTINTEDVINENVEEELHLKLKQCIVHYNEVANFCKLIQDTFSVTLFIQFNIASYVICVCLFRLMLELIGMTFVLMHIYHTYVVAPCSAIPLGIRRESMYPLTPSYFIFLIMYIIVMVLQILIPCWFGHHITDKSAALTVSLYNCEWWSRPRRFTSSLRFFMTRAGRPLTIIGGKIFPLSLTTFTSIANSAYSFYTLLRNVQTDQ